VQLEKIQMCLSIPGRILSITEHIAEVDIGGVTTRANIVLLDNVRVGDYVLVHTGFAIQKYDRNDAEETLELFRKAAQTHGLQ
jgi:hydrogenase expression/formation protein HypC